MLRFFVLLFSLGAWGFFLWRVPAWPPSIVIALLCCAGYIFGWATRKENWLIFFFSALLWAGMWLGSWVSGEWEHVNPFFDFIPGVFVVRLVLVVSLLLTSFFTFANYKMSLNFRHRRGNLDKEQLARLSPPGAEIWKAFKNIFKRKKEMDIVLSLGKEIRMKE